MEISIRIIDRDALIRLEKNLIQIMKDYNNTKVSLLHLSESCLTAVMLSKTGSRKLDFNRI